MAFAYGFGYGPGIGFGLGFLNLIGTILFFVFVFWALKFVFRGARASGMRGWAGPGSWSGHKGRAPWSPRESTDEAMDAARERLAQGEMTPEEFASVQQGLRHSRPQEGAPPGADGALEIARMRLARGEITLEEFEVVRKTLAG